MRVGATPAGVKSPDVHVRQTSFLAAPKPAQFIVDKDIVGQQVQFGSIPGGPVASRKSTVVRSQATRDGGAQPATKTNTSGLPILGIPISLCRY